MFEIGDWVKNIDPRNNPSVRKGQYAKITDIDYNYDNDEIETVFVIYQDGKVGHSNKPSKYYQVVDCPPCGSTTSSSANGSTKKGMKSIIKFVKNLGLSADERLLRKEGLKTECGEYTGTAIDLVINKICGDNEEFLVKMAKEFKKGRKADKEDEEDED